MRVNEVGLLLDKVAVPPLKLKSKSLFSITPLPVLARKTGSSISIINRVLSKDICELTKTGFLVSVDSIVSA